jgi:hypothetical protein
LVFAEDSLVSASLRIVAYQSFQHLLVSNAFVHLGQTRLEQSEPKTAPTVIVWPATTAVEVVEDLNHTVLVLQDVVLRSH